MSAFGDFAQTGPNIEPGIYDCSIESATVVKDANGNPKINDNGKHQVDVKFRIDDETTLNRRYTITFGKNSQTGDYAAFAKFLAAVTGIPLGDPRQKTVTESDLLGRRARIVTVVTDQGYVNIDSVAAPPKVKAQPVQAVIEDEIPF